MLQSLKLGEFVSEMETMLYVAQCVKFVVLL